MLVLGVSRCAGLLFRWILAFTAIVALAIGLFISKDEVQRIAANIGRTFRCQKRGPDGNVGAEVLPNLIGRALPALRASPFQRKA